MNNFYENILGIIAVIIIGFFVGCGMSKKCCSCECCKGTCDCHVPCKCVCKCCDNNSCTLKGECCKDCKCCKECGKTKCSC